MKFFKNKKPNVRNTTSSGRSPVFSYYNNRPVDAGSSRPVSRKRLFNTASSSPRQQAKLVHHLKHLPTYMAIGLILFSVLYATSLSAKPKVLIGQTKQETGLLRQPADYDKAISDILRHSIFNRSKLTISTSNVEANIEKQFPEIQKATVSIPLIGRRPVIGLDPAQPVLVLKTSTNEQYIVGEDGRALVSTTSAPARTVQQLIMVEDRSGIKPEQGKAVIPRDTVTFITTVMQQLGNKQLKVSNMELPAIANELHVRLTSTKYYLKFSLGDDPRLQTGTFLAVKQRLDGQKVTPAEYVDVRVSGRAYYK